MDKRSVRWKRLREQLELGKYEERNREGPDDKTVYPVDRHRSIGRSSRDTLEWKVTAPGIAKASKEIRPIRGIEMIGSTSVASTAGVEESEPSVGK